jgi:hypothetical protein
MEEAHLRGGEAGVPPILPRTHVVPAPYSDKRTARPFAELLIDCEEDRKLRAVLIGMLREDNKKLLSALAAALDRALKVRPIPKAA